MNCNLTDGVLTVTYEGRLDTEAAVRFESELAEICMNNPAMIVEDVQEWIDLAIDWCLRTKETEKKEALNMNLTEKNQREQGQLRT